jgi:glycosyltransferase involved in cell wall biosynthesis
VVRQLGRFHEVCVLTSAQNRSSIEAALRQEVLPNVRFHYVDLLRWLAFLRDVQGGIQLYAYLWQVRAYFAARRLHRRHHFHLFHHITYANDWMASFIGALLPVPYVRGPGGGAHQTPKGFLRELPPVARVGQRLRAVGQWLFRHDPFFILGQQRARAILVCNREALEAIPRKWRPKAQLFPVNGVSSGDLAPCVPTGSQNGKFQVLSGGKLLPIKGFGLAIKSFKAFADQYPEARFTIVGEGVELPRLEALTSELGLEEKVRFKDWMPREGLLAEMASCDVFLFPSLRDGGGAVVVEAMAAGKPVVCLDLAGPGMHVVDGCGIKVTPHSPEQVVGEMATALGRLYSDKEFRLRMGRKARERAVREYHWDRLGERLQKIYEGALGLQAGRR